MENTDKYKIHYLWCTSLYRGGALYGYICFINPKPWKRFAFSWFYWCFLSFRNRSAVIYSIFNGIYEEIYFLGVCFAVQPKTLKWVILFSLLVRISFHTYQGMLSAIGIGLIFGIYMLYTFHKSKSKNLLPFFWAYAMGDIFGLGILVYFMK